MDDRQNIPSNLIECFSFLNEMLAPESIEEFKAVSEKECCAGHFGIGMWMRNNWGLWGGSKLRDWFNKQDVWHADDMSGIIMTSYWRNLNNLPINLEEQVKYYNDYWAKSGVNVKEDFLNAQKRIKDDESW